VNKDEQEKLQSKEKKNNPMGNFTDATNRSMVGDPSALAKGGCLTKIMTLVIIFVGFLILSQCSY
jgi:hypothetical protein